MTSITVTLHMEGNLLGPCGVDLLRQNAHLHTSEEISYILFISLPSVFSLFLCLADVINAAKEFSTRMLHSVFTTHYWYQCDRRAWENWWKCCRWWSSHAMCQQWLHDNHTWLYSKYMLALKWQMYRDFPIKDECGSATLCTHLWLHELLCSTKLNMEAAWALFLFRRVSGITAQISEALSVWDRSTISLSMGLSS